MGKRLEISKNVSSQPHTISHSKIFTIRKQNIFCISFKDVSSFLLPVGYGKNTKLLLLFMNIFSG